MPSIESVSVRGLDGFRLEREILSTNSLRLYRTKDGGLSWSDASCRNVPFNGIESFDVVATGTILLCAYIEQKEERSKRLLLESVDSGRTWTAISDTKEYPGIWATHLFFLDRTTGWISSDRDDGMFMTRDSGKTWSEIQIPERIVRGFFFKDARHGRIIGGVSCDVYETEDSGHSWRKLNAAEILSPNFVRYFYPSPISRWNDFALLQSVLIKR